jgi:hypothetical protein
MNRGMTWPILGAVTGFALAACGGTSTSGEGARGDASTGDAGAPNPATSDAADDVAVDAPNEASDGGDATMDAGDGSAAPPVAVCLPLPDGGMASIGIGPDESVASGTLVGSAVNCSICDVGAVVFVFTGTDGGPPESITLGLSNTASGGDTCMLPNIAYNPMFQANIDLNDIQPGTYSSSQATSKSCTSLGLEYSTSIPPDCQGAVGPNCPAGCEVFDCIETDSGSGEYCPCVAPGYGVGYSASGLCGDPSPFGSWQVVLTSVVPYTGDAGQTAGTVLYTVHGSVSADLIAESNDGGPPAGDHATLSLTF